MAKATPADEPVAAPAAKPRARRAPVKKDPAAVAEAAAVAPAQAAVAADAEPATPWISRFHFRRPSIPTIVLAAIAVVAAAAAIVFGVQTATLNARLDATHKQFTTAQSKADSLAKKVSGLNIEVHTCTAQLTATDKALEYLFQANNDYALGLSEVRSNPNQAITDLDAGNTAAIRASQAYAEGGTGCDVPDSPDASAPSV